MGYSWSHAIDNVVLEFGGGAAGPQPQDPRNLRAERGNSIIDLRHRLTASYLWELPFGKGKPFLNHGGILNVALGGWQTNGILTDSNRPAVLARTADIDHERHGQPSGCHRNSDLSTKPCSAGSIRALSPRRRRTPTATPPATACSDPAAPTGICLCSRILSFSEQMRFEFRAEAFNVFNHPQFGLPNQNIGNAQVGSITSTVGNPRQLQMGLRFQF